MGIPREVSDRLRLDGKSLIERLDALDQANLSEERLGYPTQKPLALLERIIKASSNENDIVLDAFCGCGTALLAAEMLKRQWIGIDISPTACRVMAKRLRDNTALREDEALWKAGRGFVVQTFRGARISLGRSRLSNSRIGPSSHSEEFPTRRRSGTWASTAASSRSRPPRKLRRT